MENTKRLTVLLIDDDESFLEPLSEAFELLGFSTATVTNVKGALTVLEVMRFDAIVSDVHMPGQSGVELLNLLREREMTSKFFLMSGGCEVTREQARALGAEELLIKPFPLRLMAKRVAHSVVAA